MIGTVEPWVVSTFAAAPGVLALVGAAVGYGRIVQRLADVEKDVADMKGMGETVARIDERTIGTASEMTNLRTAVDRFVEVLLQERRSFAPSEPPPRRGR